MLFSFATYHGKVESHLTVKHKRNSQRWNHWQLQKIR